MAYKVIILYQLYMPSYFLGTFTEYPYLIFIFQVDWDLPFERFLERDQRFGSGKA